MRYTRAIDNRVHCLHLDHGSGRRAIYTHQRPELPGGRGSMSERTRYSENALVPELLLLLLLILPLPVCIHPPCLRTGLRQASA